MTLQVPENYTVQFSGFTKDYPMFVLRKGNIGEIVISTEASKVFNPDYLQGLADKLVKLADNENTTAHYVAMYVAELPHCSIVEPAGIGQLRPFRVVSEFNSFVPTFIQ